ncbi:hypothetical protein H9635_18410 [Solibacillus sp. A46]|uniref:DUF4231 domain-containing protein n=1 Tax=Solibacillus faecavium TaxID=2762221 RepID=A0ABR8Y3E5_9BACL|nr:S-4TM family putative pore-forming effector [Solibacillus faecavium]MBD8038721.1 hypothetical protein [Solibacillus faecavium]
MSEISSILERQNTDENIRYLHAQRQSYKVSKRFYLARMILSIFTPLISIILYFIFNNTLVNYVLIFSSLILILSVILELFEQKYNKIGANIQEIFDTSVFQIRWNSALLDKKISDEELYELASKEETDEEELKNWYSGLESKNEKINILVAQRMNVCWTLQQKKKFKWLLFICLLSLITTFILISSINSFTVNELFLTLIFPATPLFIYLGKNFLEIWQQEKDLERIANYINQLYEKGHPTDNEIRSIQDCIYIFGRLPNHIVPDVFYKKVRKKLENVFRVINRELTSNDKD